MLIQGLVSTIIPVFNRSTLLQEAVASVLAQTYRPIEIIIVDDGSTDDTPALCDELKGHYSNIIRVVHQKNAGVGRAREAGRLTAVGEFIQYLDSDDLIGPAKFERQVDALKRNQDCGAAYCYTRFYRIGELPVAIPWKGSGRAVSTMFPSFLNERWWDTPTPLYRRSVCDAAGPWSNLRLEEDWEYDCRIAALGTRLVHCPDFLVDVRDHSGGRLSHGSAHDPERNRERARAQELIYGHARRAGIGPNDPAMQQFARSLFLLARQCGASGLAEESRRLFWLAREASSQSRGLGLDFRVYGAVAACFGWTTAGRVACWSDHFQFRVKSVLICI